MLHVKICYAALLHIMLNKCPYYAQITLIKCDLLSENQSSGLSYNCQYLCKSMGSAFFFAISSTFTDIKPPPYKV